MTIPQLAPEILQRVALCVATENNPLGPPSGLLPLLTSSPQLYAALNVHDHPHLYAEIFRHSFDTEAIRRRFPSKQLTAQALSIELRRRWTCLTRIRHMVEPANQLLWSYEHHDYGIDEAREDLMTAYLMLMESDGLNAIHLLQYAKIDLFLEAYWRHRLVPIHYEPEMPPESEETSLFLWVMWLVTDYREWSSDAILDWSKLQFSEWELTHNFGTVLGKTLLRADDKQLTWILMPYMLGTFCYNHTYAPWIHQTLPLSSTPYPSPASPHSRPTASTTIYASPWFTARLSTNPLPFSTAFHCSTNNTYLGAPFKFTPPFASTAATLLYISWMQGRPPTPALPNPREDIPNEQLVESFEALLRTRDSGDASIFADVSSSDASELERRRGRSCLVPEHVHMRFNSVAKSWVWDDEWRRLTGCLDCRQPMPRMAKELGMPRYAFTKGSLMGEWDGRFILHSHNTYTEIMEGANPLNTLEEGYPLQDFQSWSIQEHYVYDASLTTPSNVSTGFNLPPLASSSRATSRRSAAGLPAGSPLNGFVPHTALLRRVDGKLVGSEWKSGLETFERSVGEVFYETWRGGKRGNDVEPIPSPSSTSISTTPQAILTSKPNTLSLLLTGTSIARPSMIPTHLSQRSMMPPSASTTLQGTVRSWDGLITVRAADQNENGFGVGGGAWVWRGYLVGEGNLVGRWRDGEVDVGKNAYEGVFVMRRRI
ncbi:hypothetical protein FRB94_014481 [Tulasnella sp. JGI-2019a]|nr:hypothetical protein FRB94_014481 [Tulasnella sp. JGI-2019a]KAG9016851.1 hypothetical protein FRB93_009381 [Tulasnella sp. JGI-2019a]